MKLNSKTQQYDELLNLAYTSAEEEKPWQAFVDRLQIEMGARDAIIVVRRITPSAEQSGRSQYFLVTSDRAPHLTAEYFDAAIRASNVILDLKQPQPENLHEVLAYGEFWGSELYRDFLAPVDIRYVLSIDIYRSESTCAKLVAERTEEQGSFSEKEKQLMAMVAPHVARAMRYQTEMEGGLKLQSFYEHILDKLEVGCILVDDHGAFLSANSAARRVLDAAAGVTISAGKLIAAPSVVEQQELAKAIKLAIAASRHGVKSQSGVVLGLHNTASELVLEVVVKPYFQDDRVSMGGSACVAVVISRSTLLQTNADFGVIAALYGFTKQEARVASLLGAGLSVNEVADEMSVSTNTTKTHLRGIYAKTGFNRQSQIVSLVARSTARLL